MKLNKKDFHDFFDRLAAWKIHLEGLIDLENNGISSGFKITYLKTELKKTEEALSKIEAQL